MRKINLSPSALRGAQALSNAEIASTTGMLLNSDINQTSDQSNLPKLPSDPLEDSIGELENAWNRIKRGMDQTQMNAYEKLELDSRDKKGLGYLIESIAGDDFLDTRIMQQKIDIFEAEKHIKEKDAYHTPPTWWKSAVDHIGYDFADVLGSSMSMIGMSLGGAAVGMLAGPGSSFALGAAGASLGRYQESLAEAGGNYGEVKAQLTQLRDSGDPKYAGLTDADIHSRAMKSSDTVFKDNMKLIALDIPLMMLSFAPLAKAVGKATAGVIGKSTGYAANNLFVQGIEKAAYLTAAKPSFKYMKGLASFAAVSIGEGAEEGIQYAIGDKATSEALDKESMSYTDMMYNKEFQHAVRLGMELGGFMKGVGYVGGKITDKIKGDKDKDVEDLKSMQEAQKVDMLFKYMHAGKLPQYFGTLQGMAEAGVFNPKNKKDEKETADAVAAIAAHKAQAVDLVNKFNATLVQYPELAKDKSVVKANFLFNLLDRDAKIDAVLSENVGVQNPDRVAFYAGMKKDLGDLLVNVANGSDGYIEKFNALVQKEEDFTNGKTVPKAAAPVAGKKDMEIPAVSTGQELLDAQQAEADQKAKEAEAKAKESTTTSKPKEGSAKISLGSVPKTGDIDAPKTGTVKDTTAEAKPEAKEEDQAKEDDEDQFYHVKIAEDEVLEENKGSKQNVEVSEDKAEPLKGEAPEKTTEFTGSFTKGKDKNTSKPTTIHIEDGLIKQPESRLLVKEDKQTKEKKEIDRKEKDIPAYDYVDKEGRKYIVGFQPVPKWKGDKSKKKFNAVASGYLIPVGANGKINSEDVVMFYATPEAKKDKHFLRYDDWGAVRDKLGLTPVGKPAKVDTKAETKTTEVVKAEKESAPLSPESGPVSSDPGTRKVHVVNANEDGTFDVVDKETGEVVSKTKYKTRASATKLANKLNKGEVVEQKKKKATKKEEKKPATQTELDLTEKTEAKQESPSVQANVSSKPSEEAWNKMSYPEKHENLHNRIVFDGEVIEGILSEDFFPIIIMDDGTVINLVAESRIPIDPKHFRKDVTVEVVKPVLGMPNVIESITGQLYFRYEDAEGIRNYPYELHVKDQDGNFVTKVYREEVDQASPAATKTKTKEALKEKIKEDLKKNNTVGFKEWADKMIAALDESIEKDKKDFFDYRKFNDVTRVITLPIIMAGKVIAREMIKATKSFANFSQRLIDKLHADDRFTIKKENPLFPQAVAEVLKDIQASLTANGSSMVIEKPELVKWYEEHQNSNTDKFLKSWGEMYLKDQEAEIVENEDGTFSVRNKKSGKVISYRNEKDKFVPANKLTEKEAKVALLRNKLKNEATIKEAKKKHKQGSVVSDAMALAGITIEDLEAEGIGLSDEIAQKKFALENNLRSLQNMVSIFFKVPGLSSQIVIDELVRMHDALPAVPKDTILKDKDIRDLYVGENSPLSQDIKNFYISSELPASAFVSLHSFVQSFKKEENVFISFGGDIGANMLPSNTQTTAAVQAKNIVAINDKFKRENPLNLDQRIEGWKALGIDIQKMWSERIMPLLVSPQKGLDMSSEKVQAILAWVKKDKVLNLTPGAFWFKEEKRITLQNVITEYHKAYSKLNEQLKSNNNKLIDEAARRFKAAKEIREAYADQIAEVSSLIQNTMDREIQYVSQMTGLDTEMLQAAARNNDYSKVKLHDISSMDSSFNPVMELSMMTMSTSNPMTSFLHHFLQTNELTKEIFPRALQNALDTDLLSKPTVFNSSGVKYNLANKIAKAYVSNNDTMLMSSYRGVSGKRKDGAMLNHLLRRINDLIPSLHTAPELQNNEFVQDHKEKAPRMIWLEGIKEQGFPEGTDVDKLTKKDIALAAMVLFHNKGADTGFHFIEVLGDRGKFPAVETKKRTLAQAKAKLGSIDLNNIIDDLTNILSDAQEKGKFPHLDMELREFAELYAYNYAASKVDIDAIYQGEEDQYGTYRKLTKRASQLASTGLLLVQNLEGGVPASVKAVLISDASGKAYINDGKKNSGFDVDETNNGTTYYSERLNKQMAVSSGSLFNFKDTIKGLYNRTDPKTGNRVMIKSNLVVLTKEHALANGGVDGTLYQMWELMNEEGSEIDIIAFKSTAKVHGGVHENKINYKKGTSVAEKGSITKDKLKTFDFEFSDFIVQQDLRATVEAKDMRFEKGEAPVQVYRYLMQFPEFDAIHQSFIDQQQENFDNIGKTVFSALENPKAFLEFFKKQLKDTDEDMFIADLLTKYGEDGEGKTTEEIITAMKSHPFIQGKLTSVLGNYYTKNVVQRTANRFAMQEIGSFGINEDGSTKKANIVGDSRLKSPRIVNGRVLPGEALIPKALKGQTFTVNGVEYLIIVRVPTTQMHSISLVRVLSDEKDKGYLPDEMSNTIITDLATQFKAGSDADGDQRFALSLFKPKKGKALTKEQELSNKAVMGIFDVLQKPEYFALNNAPIQLDAYDKYIEKEDAVLLDKRDFGSFMTMWENNSDAKSGIAVAARSNAVLLYLNKMKATIAGGPTINGRKIVDFSAIDKDEEFSVAVDTANLTNLIVDNTKEGKMTKIGLSDGTISMIFLLRRAGVPVKDLIHLFTKNPVGVELVKMFQLAQSPFSDMTKSSVVNTLNKKYSVNPKDEVNITTGNNMSDKDAMSLLSWAHKLSSEMYNYGEITRIAEDGIVNNNDYLQARRLNKYVSSPDVGIEAKSRRIIRFSGNIANSPLLSSFRMALALMEGSLAPTIFNTAVAARMFNLMEAGFSSSKNGAKVMNSLVQAALVNHFNIPEGITKKENAEAFYKKAIQGTDLEQYLTLSNGQIEISNTYRFHDITSEMLVPMRDAMSSLNQEDADTLISYQIAMYGWLPSTFNGGFAKLFSDEDQARISNAMDEVKEFWDNVSQESTHELLKSIAIRYPEEFKGQIRKDPSGEFKSYGLEEIEKLPLIIVDDNVTTHLSYRVLTRISGATPKYAYQTFTRPKQDSGMSAVKMTRIAGTEVLEGQKAYKSEEEVANENVKASASISAEDSARLERNPGKIFLSNDETWFTGTGIYADAHGRLFKISLDKRLNPGNARENYASTGLAIALGFKSKEAMLADSVVGPILTDKEASGRFLNVSYAGKDLNYVEISPEDDAIVSKPVMQRNQPLKNILAGRTRRITHNLYRLSDQGYVQLEGTKYVSQMTIGEDIAIGIVQNKDKTLTAIEPMTGSVLVDEFNGTVVELKGQIVGMWNDMPSLSDNLMDTLNKIATGELNISPRYHLSSVAQSSSAKTGFKLSVDKTGKDQGKANYANAYIGFGVSNRKSSTEIYLNDAKKAGLPTNEEVLEVNNPIVFVSVASEGTHVKKTADLANRVIALGGTVIMDTSGSNYGQSHSSFNKKGEGAVQDLLGNPSGQTKEGYNYWGKNPSSGPSLKYQDASDVSDEAKYEEDLALQEQIQKELAKLFPEVKTFTDPEAFQEYLDKNHQGQTFDLSKLGAAIGNALLINKKAAVQSTQVHEHAHIYWDAMPDSERSKKQLKAFYTKDGKFDEEGLIIDLGKVGTEHLRQRFQGKPITKLLLALKDFWTSVKNIFGKATKEELLQQFARKMLRPEPGSKLIGNRFSDKLKYQSTNISEKAANISDAIDDHERYIDNGFNKDLGELVTILEDKKAVEKFERLLGVNGTIISAEPHSVQQGVELKAKIKVTYTVKRAMNIPAAGNQILFGIKRAMETARPQDFHFPFNVAGDENVIGTVAWRNKHIGTPLHAFKEAIGKGKSFTAALAIAKKQGLADIDTDMLKKNIYDPEVKRNQELAARGGMVKNEVSVGSSLLGVGGKIDKVEIEGDGTTMLIDYKTSEESIYEKDGSLKKTYTDRAGRTGTASKEESHFTQLGAYAVTLGSDDVIKGNTRYGVNVNKIAVQPIVAKTDENGKIIELYEEPLLVKDMTLDASIKARDVLNEFNNEFIKMLDQSASTIFMLDEVSIAKKNNVELGEKRARQDELRNLLKNKQAERAKSKDQARREELAAEIEVIMKEYNAVSDVITKQKGIYNKYVEHMMKLQKILLDYNEIEKLPREDLWALYGKLQVLVGEAKNDYLARIFNMMRNRIIAENVNGSKDEADITKLQVLAMAPSHMTTDQPFLRELISHQLVQTQIAENRVKKIHKELEVLDSAVRKEFDEKNSSFSTKVQRFLFKSASFKYYQNMWKIDSSGNYLHEYKDPSDPSLTKAEKAYLEYIIAYKKQTGGADQTNVKGQISGAKSNIANELGALLMPQSTFEVYHNLGFFPALFKFIGDQRRIEQVELYAEMPELDHTTGKVVWTKGMHSYGDLKRALNTPGIVGKIGRVKQVYYMTKYIKRAETLFDKGKHDKRPGQVDADDIDGIAYKEGHLIRNGKVVVQPIMEKMTRTMDDELNLHSSWYYGRSKREPFSLDVHSAMQQFVMDIEFEAAMTVPSYEVGGNTISVMEMAAMAQIGANVKGHVNAQKWLDMWVDRELLGASAKGKVGEEKAAKFLIAWTYLVVMTFAPQLGVANLAIGLLNNMTHGDGRRYLKNNFKRLFVGGVPFLSKTNKATALMNQYDIVNYHPEVPDGSMWGRFVKASTWFISIGEQIIQKSAFLANIDDAIWDNFEVDKDGKVQWIDDNGPKLDAKAIAALKVKSSNLQGKYDPHDARNYKNVSAYNLVMQFKTWLPDMLRLLFGKPSEDVFGQKHVGMIYAAKMWMRWIIEAPTKGFAEANANYQQFNSLEEFKRAQKAALKSIVFMTAMYVLWASLHGDDDDKEEAKKLQNIMTQYLGLLDPRELVLTASIPALNTIDKAAQVFTSAIERTMYKRDSKWGKKGEYRFWDSVVQASPYKNLVGYVGGFQNPDYGKKKSRSSSQSEFDNFGGSEDFGESFN